MEDFFAKINIDESSAINNGNSNSLAFNLIRKMRCKTQSHKLAIAAICLNDKCLDKLSCPKCLVIFHSNCKDNLLFLDDILDDNIDGIILNTKFKEFKAFYDKYNTIPKGTHILDQNSKLIADINNKVNSFLDILVTKVNDIRDNLLNILSEKMVGDNDTVDRAVSSYLKLDELKEILAEMANIGTLNKSQSEHPELSISNGFNNSQITLNSSNLVNINSDGEEKLKKFVENYDFSLKKEINELNKKISLYSQTQNNGELVNRLEAIFTEIRNFLDQKFSINNMIFVKNKFTFNINKRSNLIELTENNTKAKKVSQCSYSSVIADCQMSRSKGIVKWQLIISGLEACKDHSENQWVNFGIVDEKYTGSNDSFPYDKCIGYSTFNQAYKVSIIKGKLENPLNNLIIELVYDPERAVFEIRNSKNDFKAMASNLDNTITYYPFVILYGPGNTAKLVFEE